MDTAPGRLLLLLPNLSLPASTRRQRGPLRCPQQRDTVPTRFRSGRSALHSNARQRPARARPAVPAPAARVGGPSRRGLRVGASLTFLGRAAAALARARAGASLGPGTLRSCWKTGGLSGAFPGAGSRGAACPRRGALGPPRRPASPCGRRRRGGLGRRAPGATRGAERPRPGETMAKWLNKYFSLGNNKTKSPPQPPRPDYREKRNGAGSTPRPDAPPRLLHLHHHTSPSFPHRRLRDDTSDLLRAYRAQKDRDFEDPYSGPGSSLRKLRAMCHPDYAPEDLRETARKTFSSSSCCAAPSATCTPGSPLLFRSHSERRPATPPDVKYISSKHRLIKVESGSGSDGADKKLDKGSKQLVTSAPPAMKDKVSVVLQFPPP